MPRASPPPGQSRRRRAASEVEARPDAPAHRLVQVAEVAERALHEALAQAVGALDRELPALVGTVQDEAAVDHPGGVAARAGDELAAVQVDREGAVGAGDGAR